MLDWASIVLVDGTEVSNDFPNREISILRDRKDVPEQAGCVVFADGGAELGIAEKFADRMTASNTQDSE
ncbi:MAG: hypothetical protein VXZ82_03850 [Planctomycetota bacterium]|nr:hypothetical protein [Planctomycetota bacterium]